MEYEYYETIDLERYILVAAIKRQVRGAEYRVRLRLKKTRVTTETRFVFLEVENEHTERVMTSFGDGDTVSAAIENAEESLKEYMLERIEEREAEDELEETFQSEVGSIDTTRITTIADRLVNND